MNAITVHVIILCLLTIVMVIMTIKNIKDHITVKKHNMESKSVSMTKDMTYDTKCNGIYQATYQIAIVGNELNFGTHTLFRLYMDEENRKMISIFLHSELEKIVMPFNNSPLINVVKSDGFNINIFKLKFVIVKPSVFASVLMNGNTSDIDNCIFLVCDRKDHSMDIFLKENGHIVNGCHSELRYMCNRTAYNTNIYNILSRQDSDMYKFGSISFSDCIGLDQNEFVELFCLMSSFNPNYVEKHSYDY